MVTVPTPPVDQAQRLRERLAALGAISEAIATSLDLDDLFRRIYQATERVLDTTIFLLGLYNEATQTVEVVRQVDSGTELPGGSFPLGSGVSSQVIRTRQPRLIRHWSVDGPRVQVQYATDQKGLPESALIVPIISGMRVVGVISLQSYQIGAYDEDDLLTLQVIAGQAAVAIENLRRSAGLDAQLQQRVSELEAILASMADALLIVDAAGCIVRLNEAARRLLGSEATTIVLGQPLHREQWGQWPLEARTVAEELSRMIEALRAGEIARDVDIEIPGEVRRIYNFSCARLQDASDAFAGGVIVFRDVTDRRDVERLKDEMLSVASHDLKTPVTIIKAQAQILQRKLRQGQVSPDLLGKALSAIDGQANRLVELLNLLLDLSRIESGRFVLDRERVDLGSLVTAITEGIQGTTDHHEIVVRADPQAEGMWDRPRLEQVVQNLVTNAVKYSPQGGRVTIEVRVDDDTATVRVRDQGIGLPADELPRVFDRFYRASGARRLEGTGLGLYICQGIIHAHGGRIWAESPGAGRGSTFCFTVPRWDARLSDTYPDSTKGRAGTM